MRITRTGGNQSNALCMRNEYQSGKCPKLSAVSNQLFHKGAPLCLDLSKLNADG